MEQSVLDYVKMNPGDGPTKITAELRKPPEYSGITKKDVNSRLYKLKASGKTRVEKVDGVSKPRWYTAGIQNNTTKEFPGITRQGASPNERITIIEPPTKQLHIVTPNEVKTGEVRDLIVEELKDDINTFGYLGKEEFSNLTGVLGTYLKYYKGLELSEALTIPTNITPFQTFTDPGDFRSSVMERINLILTIIHDINFHMKNPRVLNKNEPISTILWMTVDTLNSLEMHDVQN